MIIDYVKKNQYVGYQQYIHVRWIVLHYPAAPGWDCARLAKYLHNVEAGNDGQKSWNYSLDAHEIREHIPSGKKAWHAGGIFNDCSIGIEVCHRDVSGTFDQPTQLNLAKFCAELCNKYELDPLVHIIRHYECTRKICPKGFVENPQTFYEFREKVKGFM